MQLRVGYSWRATEPVEGSKSREKIWLGKRYSEWWERYRNDGTAHILMQANIYS